MTDTPLVEDGLFDLDVVARNAEFLRLLRHQPPEFVSSFVRAALQHEQQGTLRHRFQRHLSTAQQQFARVPQLAGEADRLAVCWADYRFARDASAVEVVLRLGAAGEPAEHVDVHGAEVLHDVAAEGGVPLFVSAHLDAYQALPPVLAALGHRTAFVMDGGARSLAAEVYTALAPRLFDRLVPVAAQERGVARRLVEHLRSGQPGLIFPEFAFSTAGYPTAQLFGRTVYAPPGTEAIARKADATVVPVLLRNDQGRPRLHVHEPLWRPGEELDRGVVTQRVFAWLATAVGADPTRWWCWEVFEELLAAGPADAPGAA